MAHANHPYDPKQSVSIQEALKMATYEVAWTGFDEHERGSLEQGKTADMVVLNQNPLKMDPKNLLNLKVNQLYLSGKTYKPKMSIFNMILNSIFKSKRRETQNFDNFTYLKEFSSNGKNRGNDKR